MKTATVGEIQKNFSKVINTIEAGEEITVTKRGVPIARIMAMAPKKNIDWPDFAREALKIKGKPLSQDILDQRQERI